jgi:predicted nucleic acid-binding protein
MFVCDTNLLAEIMRDEPNAGVADWLRGCRIDELYTTVICQMEIAFGIRRLSVGKRRSRLEDAAKPLFLEDFKGRLLTFDAVAADRCADMRIRRQRSGRPIAIEDAMIAAIAAIQNAAVVTRDEAGFLGTGVAVINPWR